MTTQDVSYSPMLLHDGAGEEAASSPDPASLKCFAAFRRLRRLSICMKPWLDSSLQLDVALEGGPHSLCHTHIMHTKVPPT